MKCDNCDDGVMVRHNPRPGVILEGVTCRMCNGTGVKLERRMSDSALLHMTLNDINAGLRNYREDFRYTRLDAMRFVELWNDRKISTIASLIDVEGTPCVIVVNA